MFRIVLKIGGGLNPEHVRNRSNSSIFSFIIAFGAVEVFVILNRFLCDLYYAYR